MELKLDTSKAYFKARVLCSRQFGWESAETWVDMYPSLPAKKGQSQNSVVSGALLWHCSWLK